MTITVPNAIGMPTISAASRRCSYGSARRVISVVVATRPRLAPATVQRRGQRPSVVTGTEV